MQSLGTFVGKSPKSKIRLWSLKGLRIKGFSALGIKGFGHGLGLGFSKVVLGVLRVGIAALGGRVWEVKFQGLGFGI